MSANGEEMFAMSVRKDLFGGKAAKSAQSQVVNVPSLAEDKVASLRKIRIADTLNDGQTGRSGSNLGASDSPALSGRRVLNLLY